MSFCDLQILVLLLSSGHIILLFPVHLFCSLSRPTTTESHCERCDPPVSLRPCFVLRLLSFPALILSYLVQLFVFLCSFSPPLLIPFCFSGCGLFWFLSSGRYRLWSSCPVTPTCLFAVLCCNHLFVHQELVRLAAERQDGTAPLSPVQSQPAVELPGGSDDQQPLDTASTCQSPVGLAEEEVQAVSAPPKPPMPLLEPLPQMSPVHGLRWVEQNKVSADGFMLTCWG